MYLLQTLQSAPRPWGWSSCVWKYVTRLCKYHPGALPPTSPLSSWGSLMELLRGTVVAEPPGAGGVPAAFLRGSLVTEKKGKHFPPAGCAQGCLGSQRRRRAHDLHQMAEMSLLTCTLPPTCRRVSHGTGRSSSGRSRMGSAYENWRPFSGIWSISWVPAPGLVGAWCLIKCSICTQEKLHCRVAWFCWL